MQKFVSVIMIAFMASALFQACQNTPQEQYETEWLGDTKQEMIINIEEQFQGFSATMREVAYRYHELYWAGKDQNWEYAEYQREHIEEALEQGFIRRPERELSAQQFVSQALPTMKETIKLASLEAFEQEFVKLTATCNTCHAMEDVPFMTIKVPTERHTVVYY